MRAEPPDDEPGPLELAIREHLALLAAHGEDAPPPGALDVLEPAREVPAGAAANPEDVALDPPFGRPHTPLTEPRPRRPRSEPRPRREGAAPRPAEEPRPRRERTEPRPSRQPRPSRELHRARARRRRHILDRLAALLALAAGVSILYLGVSAVLDATGLTHQARRTPAARAAAKPTRPHPSPYAAAGDPRLFPFRPGPQRSPTAADALPSMWADGRLCATGCRPLGAIDGWPLRPFHSQHALRSALDERRTSGFHVGLDIQASDNQAVYAIQPGYAHVLQSRGVDARVQVGNYIYWHIRPLVLEGQYVEPYKTIVGRVKLTAGHLHLSEVVGKTYVNPLRPQGRVLSPYADTMAPVIGPVRLSPDGQALVSAFDPQSFHARTTYETPVLAPAAMAYQVFDSAGKRVTPLEWVFRGTHLIPNYAIPLIFAPTAHSPGWGCFAHRVVCVPDWTYRLAGGLTPPLTGLGLPSGRYRLSVYAWDWAGNVAARDAAFRATSIGTVER